MSITNVVDPDNGQNNNPAFEQQTDKEKALIAYVMGYVDSWKDYRDSNFEGDWHTYYRMWKGVWHPNDKTRTSERSKLISPALQQSIEISVAEQEEATFNKKMWFDLSDDIIDEDKEEMQGLRDLLIEDMEKVGVPAAVTETYLNGALYGTGIGKIVVEEVVKKTLNPKDGSLQEREGVDVLLVPISPDEFVIDPAASSVDSALGCAHDTIKPRHEIEQKKRDGIYKDKDLGSFTDVIDVAAKGEQKDATIGDKTRITEFHGLIPISLIQDVGIELADDEELIEVLPKNKEDNYSETLVESIVTIANGAILLKAVENPFIFKDRSIVAYQHDKVPNRFWGRGVAEKGINVQRALDAELRARIDGLALTIHPMLAVDATRLPRGVSPGVSPGKTILTNGDPREVLMPFNFGNINSQTFAQGGELERMIQMATGSMDSATSPSSNSRNATASGMSMLQSASIKRTKRTMQNISRDFLAPAIRKMAWRHMQFNNERYPIDDYEFVPITTMGMMAREFETSQLTNMLNMAPPESPLFGLIVTSIIDNGSGENKEEFKAAVKQMFTPPPPDPLVQKVKELEVKKLELEIQEIASRSRMNVSNAEAREQDADTNEFRAEIEELKVTGQIQDNELDRRAAPKKTEGKK